MIKLTYSLIKPGAELTKGYFATASMLESLLAKFRPDQIFVTEGFAHRLEAVQALVTALRPVRESLGELEGAVADLIIYDTPAGLRTQEALALGHTLDLKVAGKLLRSQRVKHSDGVWTHEILEFELTALALEPKG